jgi:hypothetical protein
MSRSSVIAAAAAPLVAVFVAVGLVAGAAPVRAESGAVSISATVNGQDVATASMNKPLRLEPGKSVDVAVVVTNRGSTPLAVAGVELVGRVLGLSFFTYVTTVDTTVAPGATDTVQYRLDLIGLKGEATGLIGGQLVITDSSGDPIAAVPTVTDVRGSLLSVYGLFGLALVVLTALAIVDAAVAIARHRLSTNRWQRGLRLLVPGIGVALVLAFSASVVRLWVPTTERWLVMAGISAALFFAAGYLSPTPDDEDDEDLDDDDEDDDGDSDGAHDAGTNRVAADGVGA